MALGQKEKREEKGGGMSRTVLHPEPEEAAAGLGRRSTNQGQLSRRTPAGSGHLSQGAANEGTCPPGDGDGGAG